MIRVYTVAGKKLQSGEIVSSKKLHDLGGKVDWLWVDCVDLDNKETAIISDFFGVEAKILNDINARAQKEKTYPSCERYRDYSLISIPFVEFGKTLQVHPISLIMKEKMLITSRKENSTKIVGKVVETLGSYIIENGEALPSFVVSRLFREMGEENSRAMMSLKEQIDKVEEEALENPRDRSVTRSVFGLKREISTLHRLLWVGKELISDVKECVVPHVKLDEEARVILADATDDVDRELEFVDSYSRTLDSILSLQDLGLIHRLERTLIFLTIILLLLDALIIFGEYILSTILG